MHFKFSVKDTVGQYGDLLRQINQLYDFAANP
jgi:hypothetical protein